MHKKVLITGGSGLIGTHLIDALIAEGGYKIYNAARHQVNTHADEVQFIMLDLSTEWDASVLPENIDAVIHLSQSEYFRNFPDKANEVFYVNTLSTLKLINYAIRVKAKQFIYASSAGIYGTNDKGFDESEEIVYKHELGFYLGTKHCSEVILENYNNLIDIVVLRFFFVYGKGQRKDMLIPRLIENIKHGQPITLHGNDGISINPVYAGDAALSVMRSLNLAGNHKINVAGPDILSLREIGNIIGDKLMRKPVFEISNQTPKNLIGNLDNFRRVFDFSLVQFERGINSLI
jgi:UDP-glucose 4-epimerase